jgi:hypothetical protein
MTLRILILAAITARPDDKYTVAPAVVVASGARSDIRAEILFRIELGPAAAGG